MKQKTITFVVPVYGNSGLFLGRCLHSLLDNQDYRHKDVIVVFDGDKQMKSALVQEERFKDDDRVQWLHVKHGGAPAARNAGLDKATGDYVCFFDCDSVLKAGAIRTWMETFDQNPEVGFVYGGYRFFMKEKYNTIIPAHDFDEWLLTCNNYISSMNPIKRELCLKWDEELKSLQDWDFWLRVTKSGIKGKKIDDILVITQPPDDESISGHSHKNWIESYNTVRVKNGIVGRDAAFYSFGAPFQAKRRAKFVGADYRDIEMLVFKPHDYKALISMGYYVDAPLGAYSVFAEGNGCKKIIHWIGTDVYQLKNKSGYDIEYFADRIDDMVTHQFANAPWLVDELAKIGVKSELLYCPIDSSNYSIGEFPKHFTIAVYRSDSNPMHNEQFMLDVAMSCPDIDFKFFGGTKPPTQFGLPDNIEFVGTIKDEDMPDFINTTSAIARITVHDGFPASLCEWAMSGRPFITNIKDMPKGHYVDVQPTKASWIEDKEKTIKAIRELQRSMKSLAHNTQVEVRDYFSDLMSPDKYVNRMKEVINA